MIQQEFPPLNDFYTGNLPTAVDIQDIQISWIYNYEIEHREREFFSQPNGPLNRIKLENGHELKMKCTRVINIRSFCSNI